MISLGQIRMHTIGLFRDYKRFGIVLGVIIALSYTTVHARSVSSCPGTAAPFDSSSTGVDGALDFSNVAPGTTILFDPATFHPPLDQDGDSVYHFTTINIPAGVTVRLSAELLGTQPVVWLSSGAVLINGNLDLNGQSGHGSSAPAIPAVAGAGGYGGGTGRRSNAAAQPGNGPGGGQVTAGNGGSAGHAVEGGGGTGVGGAAYGNDFLLPLLGGSGGAGGAGSDFDAGNTGGGAGGGAILIASSVWIGIGGVITADSGSSGAGQFFPGTSFGGDGSGGAIRLMAPIICGAGFISAISPHGVSNYGSYGRVRLEAFQHAFTGSINPTPNFVTPGLIFPPANTPSVRVVRVAGVDVPATPTGSFLMPDVTLDNILAIVIEIEARHVPPGTVVQLTITPETGPQQKVASTPLAGTLPLSTATATVALPHGFSRFFVQANWTP